MLTDPKVEGATALCGLPLQARVRRKKARVEMEVQEQGFGVTV